ncbi:MAG: clostripain-related cysteine peptidase [Eubacteriales bacterium]|nr:clostripain-related cysteine peptidase [Eubacteriales bacterium]
MADNRPRGRKRNVTSQGSGGGRRGENLGGGPVGTGHSPAGGSGGNRSGGRGMGGLPLILVLIIALLGGGGTLGGLFGGSGGSGSSSSGSGSYSATGNNWNVEEDYTPSSGDSNFNYYNSPYGGSGSLSSGWSGDNASATELDTSVASGSREKYTSIKGGGKDVVTIMVYMCGTDLESNSGMGTSDLQEMAAAKIADNVNLLVYTGGCAKWRNNIVSSSQNQIYQVKSGGLKLLSKNEGNAPMTSPDNLSGYIKWCASKFPADRYELILWDHGGGSTGGFGYDEKNKRSGSMSLGGISKALRDGGVKFDFIGFDACLMATMENALMLNSYGDYLIASEETEPGVGWYYTDWLSALSRNTSMPTLEIGKNIVDTFVDTCARKCQGQKTTLSVVDLAELAGTAPARFSSFSKSVTGLIEQKNYQQVSQARNQTREFASSSRIDQVDLVHLAKNMGTPEGEELASALRAAVKYNRTSLNMANAYGLSIYFPYRTSAKYVDSMSQTYSEIGMDADYTKCIRQFASMQVSGMAANGGSGSPYDTLFGDYAGGFSGLDSSGSGDLIGTLLGSFLGGDYSSISGLSSGGASFLSDRALSDEEMEEYFVENHFDPNQLKWVSENGQDKIKLSQDQWNLVTGLDLNLFFDDGEGYIELGLDNVYDFDEQGNLIADSGRAWLAINGEAVPYYHTDTVDDGTSYTITGRVPCLINDEKSNLIIVFNNEHPNGYVAGAYADYGEDDEVDVIAKNMTALEAGDTIDFVCDFYRYDGTFEGNYKKNRQIVIVDPDALEEELAVSDMEFLDDERTIMTYRFVDIYGKEYWTEALPK